MMPEDELPTAGAALLASMPDDAEELTRRGQCFASHHHGAFVGISSTVFVALAHERFSNCQGVSAAARQRSATAAVAMAAKTMDRTVGATAPDLQYGGELQLFVHNMAQRCQGRVHSGRGDVMRAARCFEGAAASAAAGGYNHFELLALQERQQYAPEHVPQTVVDRAAELTAQLPA